jgi:hypothetical protein
VTERIGYQGGGDGAAGVGFAFQLEHLKVADGGGTVAVFTERREVAQPH